MKIRVCLLVLATILLLQSCNTNKLTLTGEVENLKGKVYLATTNAHKNNFWDNAILVDSTEINQEKFSFSIPEKGIYRIVFAERKDFPLWVAIEKQSLTLRKINPDKPTEIVVEGYQEKEQELFRAFWDFYTSYKKSLQNDTLYAQLQALWQQETNEKAKDSLKGLLQQKDWAIYREYSERNYPLLMQSMPSLVAVGFAEHLDLLKDYVFLKDFSDKVAQQMPNEPSGQRFVELISRLQSTQLDKLRPAKVGLNIGDIAPDFSLPTPDGKLVSLSSFRGKVVLVDFWAAWCRPCRMENPYVVAAYNKFKHKGFDVLGVSLDEDREMWLNAIEKDKLTWTHVSDLKMWDSAVISIYEINAIPSNFLIDKDGRILAKNLRGHELEQKLQEIFQADKAI